MASVWERGLVWVRRVADTAATLMFTGIFAVFIFSVAMRYGFNKPLAWADEINVILMLWMVFTASAFVLKDEEHVAFDIFWEAASPSVRRGMGLLGAVLLGGLFIAALPAVWSYVTFLWRERTPVLEWRLDRVYFIYVIFWCCVILRCVWSFWTLLRPGWRSRVEKSVEVEEPL